MSHTLLVTGTNSTNAALTRLHELTLQNKKDYAARHGYDFEAWDLTYDEAGFAEQFKRLKVALLKYNTVFQIGVDVLLMNHCIDLNEEFEFAPLTIAKEHLRWWPINVDVCIWRQSPIAQELLTRLLNDMPIWTKYKWLWQTHLFNLIHSVQLFRDHVQIVEAVRMGSTVQKGLSEWQLGQFILHLLDMSQEQKIELAKQFLPLAGVPQWTQ